MSSVSCYNKEITMKKFFFAVCIGLIVCVSSGWADRTDHPNALGVFAGYTGGGLPYGGLHYQRWFSKFGIQAEGVGFYDQTDQYFYSIMADALFPVYSNDFSNLLGGSLYLFGSLGHSGQSYEWEEVPVEAPDSVMYDLNYVKEFQAKLHVGAGIGIEVVLFKNFSFPFHFGMGGDIPLNKTALNTLGIAFTFGGGVRYRF